MAHKYDSDEWGEESDGEDESQVRHAHHPASSSRETVEITTVTTESVSFGRAMWKHAAETRRAVNRTESVFDVPAGSGIATEMSLEDVIKQRRKRFGQGPSTEVSRKEENMSLSQIIKSRKIVTPAKLPGWNGRKQQKGQKRTRWDQSSTAGTASEELVVEYQMEEDGTVYSDDEAVMEGAQVRKKSKPLEKKEVTFTPESGIRLLLEKGFSIGVRVYGLISKDGDNSRRRRWRACYYYGLEGSTDVLGVGEGATKVLARESAALDFIEKLGRRRLDLRIPRCEIPKGCRIVPAVMKALEGLCDRLDLGEPYYSEELVMHGGREKYRFTIHIGDYDFAGTSYNLKYARNKAAKKAYDSLNDTGRVFQYEPITIGDHCSDGSSFSLVDAEEMHILKVNRPLPKKKPSASYVYTPLNGSKNREKIILSPVSTFVMSPSLMQIRQFIQAQKSGGVPANAECSSEPDPTGQEEFFETVSEHEPSSFPEQFNPADFHNPPAPAPSVASSSRAPVDPVGLRNPLSYLGGADDDDYFSTQHIEKLWGSQLRDNVSSFLEELETYSSGAGAHDAAESEDGIDDDATSMTINAYGSSGSFKLANIWAKNNLSDAVSSIEEAYTKLKTVSRRSALFGGSSKATIKTEKKNPFH